MKKKIKLKKIIILFTLITMIFIQNNIYATDSIISGAENFISTGEFMPPVGGVATIELGGLKSSSEMIYNTFLAIAMVVAVIVAAYLGVKFMLASAVEKAEVKESLLVFVIGCIVAFGAFGIWKVALLLAA